MFVGVSVCQGFVKFVSGSDRGFLGGVLCAGGNKTGGVVKSWALFSQQKLCVLMLLYFQNADSFIRQ